MTTKRADPGPHEWVHLYRAGGEARVRAISLLRVLLTRHQGNVVEAAAELGRHEVTLHNWITDWGQREWLNQQPWVRPGKRSETA